jgi:hypothetical protein
VLERREGGREAKAIIAFGYTGQFMAYRIGVIHGVQSKEKGYKNAVK